MRIPVKFFASYKELVKTSMMEMEIPSPATVLQFKQLLIQEFPALESSMVSAIISVNHKFSFDEDLIVEGNEIALFPPVSGGAMNQTHLDISENPFDINQLVQKITFQTTGAICAFTGIVRELNETENLEKTIALEYEAYLPMALEKMEQIADEIRSRWGRIEGIVIVQRIGYLPKGTQTIFIACSASHRDDGIFDAAHFGIDRLKEIVPIWKKEIHLQGEHWKEGSYHPTRDD